MLVICIHIRVNDNYKALENITEWLHFYSEYILFHIRKLGKRDFWINVLNIASKRHWAISMSIWLLDMVEWRWGTLMAFLSCREKLGEMQDIWYLKYISNASSCKTISSYHLPFTFPLFIPGTITVRDMNDLIFLKIFMSAFLWHLYVYECYSLGKYFKISFGCS